MWLRFALAIALLTTSVAVAQDLPDAGLPDGSVGEGGADRDNEERDTNDGPCVDSKRCTMGFECVNGRCVPAPVIDLGCTSAPALVMAALAALLWNRRRA